MPLYAVSGPNGSLVIRAASGARALELYGADEGMVEHLSHEGPEGVLAAVADAPASATCSDTEPREVDVTNMDTPRGMRAIRNLDTGTVRIEAKQP